MLGKSYCTTCFATISMAPAGSTVVHTRACCHFIMSIIFKDYNWTINSPLGIKHQDAGFKKYLEKYSASIAYLDFRSKLMRDNI